MAASPTPSWPTSRFRTAPRYLAVAPISHVAGTKVLPSADARRHRAPAEGLRSGGGAQDDRARADQFHAARADHDLRAARPSRARPDRPLLARAAALRRLADVADAGWSRAWSGSGRCSRSSTARPSAIRSRCCARPTTTRHAGAVRCPAAFRSPPATVKLLDDDDREVATGEAGEICVRAPHVMAEYWKRPEQTAETLQERLAAYRRHRARGRARLPVHPRPQEGHDRLRRLQHLSARGRGRPVAPIPASRWSPWSACPTPNGARRSSPSSCAARRRPAERRGADQPGQGDEGRGACAKAHRVRRRELPMTGVGKVDKKVLKAGFWAGQDRMVG